MWAVISLVGCFLSRGGGLWYAVADVFSAAYLGWDISADLGIRVSFAGPLLRPQKATEEQPIPAIRNPQVICELQPLVP